MKRRIVGRSSFRPIHSTATVFFLALLFSLAAASVTSQSKVLLMVRTGDDPSFFIKNEVRVMLGLLTEAGCRVQVATESGEPIGSGTDALNADLKFSDVQIESYAAVVVPCMGASSLPVPKSLIALIKDADSKGIAIAAQNSLEVLSPTGLSARKIAKGPGVVTDGNLVTSYNCPYMAKQNGQPIDTEGLIKSLIVLIRDR